MAYIYKPDDEEEQLGQAPAQSQLASAPIAGASQATGDGKASKSGSWVNLNQYLKNQPQIEQSAQRIVNSGDPLAKSEKAKQSIGQAQSALTSQGPKNITEQEKQILSNAINAPTLNDQTAKTTWQNVNKEYTGPTKVDQSLYGKDYEEASTVNIDKQRPVDQQLLKLYNDNITVGKQALDLFALRNDPNSYSMIEKAKQDAATRQSQLDNELKKNAQYEQTVKDVVGARKQYAGNVLGQADTTAKNIDRSVESRYYNELLPTYQTVKYNIGTDTGMTPEQAAYLGLDPTAYNAIKGKQRISPEQAAYLGINFDQYNRYIDSLEYQKNQQDKYAPYYDEQQKNLSAAMSAQKLQEDLYELGPDKRNVFDSLWASWASTQGINGGGLSGLPAMDEASQRNVRNYLSEQGITLDEAHNRMKEMMQLNANVGSYSNPVNWASAPHRDYIPEFQDFLELSDISTNPYIAATGEEAYRLNALNDIFSLGRENVTPETQKFKYGVNDKKFTDTLRDYLNSAYTNQYKK